VDGVPKALQLYLDSADHTQYVIPCKISKPGEKISKIIATLANTTVSILSYESKDNLSIYCD